MIPTGEIRVGDFHSHLVPGVDDGARTVPEALEAVERMVAAGIGRIITTPHLNASLTRDTELLTAALGRMDESWRKNRDRQLEVFAHLALIWNAVAIAV